jgi:hypothetical protein
VVRRMLAVGLVMAWVVAVVPAARASVGAQPRSSVTFDGHIQVAATNGTTVYVGGEFTHATDLGGNVVTRGRLAALDARTGALLSWNPRANKAVYAIAVDAAHGTVYVGGDFSTVGSATRHRLAAVDAVSGAVTAWNHQADGRVRTMDVSASRLYAGGQFTGVDGASRDRLAAFSLADGRLDQAWRPVASDRVYTVKVSPSGDRVYVGGRFETLNGTTQHGFAGAVDPVGGAIVNGFAGRVRYQVTALTVTGDTVYAAGDGSGGHLVAWRPDGSLKFPTVQTDGGAQAVAVLDGEVYVGGHQDNVCLTGNGTQGTGGGFSCNGARATRHKLFSVNATTGAVTGWDPNANSPLGIFTLAASPAAGTVAAGGDFTLVGGRSQRHFALFT